MRTTQLYAPTLRETPAEAEVISHQLMLRAGMLRKAAGGIYTYLPLALRVLKKIEAIVREEMDAKGGQELLMPIIQPAEMWLETGRWDVYGDEMFRVKDRHKRDFCLGPTHEEMITTLVRTDVKSYRQLPLMLYQIQNKYRDEIRPRFGLMRGREFIMKDLYSFDRDAAGLDVSYNKMYEAYSRIFSRCGLVFRAVEADAGAIGGSGTHEFMVIADSGEASIVFCPACEYAANVEKAATITEPPSGEAPQAMQEVATPGAKTIAEVAAFLQVAARQTIKAVAYETDKGLVMALVRGDHEVNEIKVQNAIAGLNMALASDEAIAATGSVAGFLGPVGAKGWTVIADLAVMNMVNAVVGANRSDLHLLNVQPGRDFQPHDVVDIRLVQEGDACPQCSVPLQAARGIEVGQVFKLFTKYSEALKATFLDENGREQPMVMGCYGIGVSRTMAAAIEQNYDADGIIWPVSIAPFQVAVIPVNPKDQTQITTAEQVYETLCQAGVEAVLDDRAERPGVKFKDADLIGYPLRIVIGPKTLQEGVLEVKARRTGEVRMLPAENYLPAVQQWLQEL